MVNIVIGGEIYLVCWQNPTPPGTITQKKKKKKKVSTSGALRLQIRQHYGELPRAGYFNLILLRDAV